MLEKRCRQGFGGKPERRRKIGRPRVRWNNDIKMDLQKIKLGFTICLRIGPGGGLFWTR